ncbi:MAG: hypothetical protein P4M00_01045 [Azospirillaceae bacterium]|nr:hypothetical protein [Azospirillaceae bacterium]
MTATAIGRKTGGRLPAAFDYALAALAALGLVLAFRMPISPTPEVIHDPDTWIRLVRLRQEIQQGMPLDAVAGGNLGGPLVLHWSHLLEAVMAVAVLPLQYVLGLDRALITVGAMVGPLSIAGVAAAATWAMDPLVATQRTAIRIAMLTATTPILVNYGLFGSGTHHVALVAMLVLTSGQALRVVMAPRRDVALGLGLVIALAVWLSFEAMIFAGFAFGGVMVAMAVSYQSALIVTDQSEASGAGAPLRALGSAPHGARSPSRPYQPAMNQDHGGLVSHYSARRLALADALAVAALTATAAMLAVLAIDPPDGGWTVPRIDRLALPHVCVMAALAVIGIVLKLALVRKTPPIRIAGVLAVTVLVTSGIWFSCFHASIGTPLAVLTADSPDNIWRGVSELAPITRPLRLLGYLGPCLVGMVAFAVLSRKHLGGTRPNGLAAVAWLYAPACGLVLLGAAAIRIRFAPYASAVGIAGMAWLLAVALERPDADRRIWPMAVITTATVLLATTLPLAAVLTDISLAPGDPTRKPCGGAAAARLLDRITAMPSGADDSPLGLTHVNDVPELLFRVPGLRTVGALYHRNVDGLSVFQQLWNGPIAGASAALRAHRVAFILACPAEDPKAARPPQEALPTSLGAALDAGAPPAGVEAASPYQGANQPMLFSVE